MTPRIPTLSDDQAPAAARRTLDTVRRAVGTVPNLHRTLAHAPAALRAYVEMAGALSGGVLAPALREQLALAIAGANDCAYCASAHTFIGAAAGVDPGELAVNLAGRSADPRVRAALGFARRLLEARGKLADSDFDAVRAAGYTDAEIVEMIAHVGLNTFTNLFNVAMRTEIDFPLVEAATAR